MLALDYIGAGDTNQISLLYYGQIGDGIDWHLHGNIYLGKCWAENFTLHEAMGQAHSKLEIQQNGVVKTFPVGVVENTLLVFQGAQVKHRVHPMYKKRVLGRELGFLRQSRTKSKPVFEGISIVGE